MSVGLSRNPSLQLHIAKPGSHLQILSKGSKSPWEKDQSSTARPDMTAQTPVYKRALYHHTLSSLSLGHLRKWGNTSFRDRVDPHTYQNLYHKDSIKLQPAKPEATPVKRKPQAGCRKEETLHNKPSKLNLAPMTEGLLPRKRANVWGWRAPCSMWWTSCSSTTGV